MSLRGAQRRHLRRTAFVAAQVSNLQINRDNFLIGLARLIRRLLRGEHPRNDIKKTWAIS